MSTESWIGIIALLSSVAGSYFLVWWRMGKITATLETLVAGAKEDRREHVRIWDKLDQYGKDIAVLQTTQK